MKKVWMTILAGAVALLFAGSLAATPVISNGSFESCTAGAGHDCSAAVNILFGVTAPAPVGSADQLTDWTITTGNMNWILDPGGWQAAAGARSLDMNGSVQGTIGQTVAGGIAGQSIRIVFDMSGNFFGAGTLPDPKTLMVKVIQGGYLFQEVFAYPHTAGCQVTGVSDMCWVEKATSWFSLPVSGAFEINILSTDPDTPFGPALDNVRIQDSGVPEPGTLSMFLGVGLVGLAAALRRKR
jgi:hypothetical protein